MDAFVHVIALLALVFVIALALLLERVSEIFLARPLVRFSALAALASVNAVLLVYTNWLSLWEIHGATEWKLATVTLLFLFALSVFFVCSLALPRKEPHETNDLEAHYWRERMPFYLAWLACSLLAIASNLSLAPALGRANVINENLSHIFGAAVAVFALLVPARWAQWAAGLALTANQMGYLLAFDADLV
ncbi:MAG: hypothetical protein ACREH4_13615 [Vitreimonas sp.]